MHVLLGKLLVCVTFGIMPHEERQQLRSNVLSLQLAFSPALPMHMKNKRRCVTWEGT